MVISDARCECLWVWKMRKQADRNGGVDGWFCVGAVGLKRRMDLWQSPPTTSSSLRKPASINACKYRHVALGHASRMLRNMQHWAHSQPWITQSPTARCTLSKQLWDAWTAGVRGASVTVEMVHIDGRGREEGEGKLQGGWICFAVFLTSGVVLIVCLFGSKEVRQVEEWEDERECVVVIEGKGRQSALTSRGVWGLMRE